MLRILHDLDSRLTDGGKVVSPTHRLHFTPQKHLFSAFGTHFCYKIPHAPLTKMYHYEINCSDCFRQHNLCTDILCVICYMFWPFVHHQVCTFNVDYNTTSTLVSVYSGYVIHCGAMLPCSRQC
jgi:hypothetical protein